jgi:hypothetical protein
LRGHHDHPGRILVVAVDMYDWEVVFGYSVIKECAATMTK